MDCKRSGAWPLEPNWQIAAVAASSQGWVLLEHPEKATPSWGCEYSAVDLASHRALNGWPIRTSRCGIHIAVAVGAEALCFNVDENLHCRAINGAAEIPVPKQARGYQLNQAAISSARVVADRWEYDRDPWWSLPLIFWIPYPGSPPLPRKRAVFDLRSQTWISSWKPRIQDARSPYITDHPYHCALSSSGEFLAESGDGGVTLYRFAP
jgi:hypothetical protein